MPCARKYSAMAVARTAPAGPDERRDVARRRDHDRAREALRAESAAHEIADLAATFADQRGDDDVRVGLAAEHAEQRRLADARACEEADALAAAERKERVDRADARLELRVDGAARERRRGLRLEGRRARQLGERASVEGLPEGVDHAAEEPLAHRHR